MKLSEVTATWLVDWTWSLITDLNADLCRRGHALHKPTSDGHEACFDYWQSNHSREMTLAEALAVLLRCHRFAPFCFFNGNTFASVARLMLGPLPIPALQVSSLRSAAGHFVTGVMRLDELLNVIDSIELAEDAQ